MSSRFVNGFEITPSMVNYIIDGLFEDSDYQDVVEEKSYDDLYEDLRGMYKYIHDSGSFYEPPYDAVEFDGTKGDLELCRNVAEDIAREEFVKLLDRYKTSDRKYLNENIVYSFWNEFGRSKNLDDYYTMLGDSINDIGDEVLDMISNDSACVSYFDKYVRKFAEDVADYVMDKYEEKFNPDDYYPDY